MLVATGKREGVPSYLATLPYFTRAALVLILVYRILFYNTWLVRNDADRGADDLVHVSNFLFDYGDVG